MCRHADWQDGVVEQTEQGGYFISADEMAVMRQGLFVTLFHADSVAKPAYHTITGYERDEFRQLMWQIDELSGHNAASRRFFENVLEELATRSLSDLRNQYSHVMEVVDYADRHNFDVPSVLRSALQLED